VDPRLILTNLDNEEDETLTLRLAIQQDYPDQFWYFWNNYHYLYNEQHVFILAQFMLFIGSFDLLQNFLQSEITQKIFLRTPASFKGQFWDIFSEDKLTTVIPPEAKM
jgi:hypothetical protein